MSGYGYIRERSRPGEPSAKPQITSFADITLVLLVIFLVTASAGIQLVRVALPEGQAAGRGDPRLAFTMSISKHPPVTTAPAAAAEATAAEAPAARPADDDPWLYYFEDDTIGVEPRNLWRALAEIRGDNQWSKAMIRADKDTPCRRVALLVQCLQSLGVDEIGFVMADENQK